MASAGNQYPVAGRDWAEPLSEFCRGAADHLARASSATHRPSLGGQSAAGAPAAATSAGTSRPTTAVARHLVVARSTKAVD